MRSTEIADIPRITSNARGVDTGPRMFAISFGDGLFW
jgi:hypothetical protein